MKTQQTLTIAEGVTFPISLVTERLAWLGRVGQGKTYGAMKAAELMLDARAQIIVIDFVGSWSGLRVPGAGPAYDIPVFGGMRGDCPLDPRSGERTADVSSTPVVGAEAVPVKPMTKLDISELVEAMRAVNDNASDDGDDEGADEVIKSLRARIKTLEAAKVGLTGDDARALAMVNNALGELSEGLGTYIGRLQMLGEKVDVARGYLRSVGGNAKASTPPSDDATDAPHLFARRPSTPLGPNSRADAESGPGVIGDGALRKMLIALAQRPKGLTRQQIAARANIGTGSSTWRNNVAKARGLAWITVEGNTFAITEAGKRALGSFKKLPTGADLISYWANELGDAALGKVFAAIVDVYPRSLTREDIGKRAGVGTGSSTFRNNLARLKHLELIVPMGDGFAASRELFGA